MVSDEDTVPKLMVSDQDIDTVPKLLNVDNVIAGEVTAPLTQDWMPEEAAEKYCLSVLGMFFKSQANINIFLI